PRGHQPIEGGTVALAARCIVTARSLCPTRHVVRVVAGGAVQRALAFEETFGSAYPVNGVHELELVIVTSARRVIEEEPVGAQRPAWSVSERSPIVPLERIRQGEAGGFEMALHAHLLTPVRAQPRRI